MLQTVPAPPPPDVTPAAPAMLAIRGLHAAYGQSEVLHGLDIAVAPGEIVAVMGRNGMGKSTLMKTLMGILPATSGTIAIDGHDVTGLKSHARVARGLAYVPQGRMIFSTMTVQENIETGLTVTGARRVPEDLYAMFPVLLEMKDRRGGNLSGGQQQQLAIARALVTRPKLLVLDEPTEGIQPSIIKDIGRAVTYLRSKGEMAIVLVEQYFEWARDLCDTYAVMDRGQVVDAGARAEMDEAQVLRWLSV